MRLNGRIALLLSLITLLLGVNATDNFTIVHGQIYTPGLAIIDSPQPDTPEGGDFLQVALDISGDGRLPIPPYPKNIETGIFNISIFLYSYTTGLNLTITNATAVGWRNDSREAPEFHCNISSNQQYSTSTQSNGASDQSFENAGCQDILLQESGSTVKHINWLWPNCLVGNGGANNGPCGQSGSIQDCLEGTARGPYNISIHQSFIVNSTWYYSIFDLPIQVTNSIPNTTQHSNDGSRPRCDLRNNVLMGYTGQVNSSKPPPDVPYMGPNLTVLGLSARSMDSASTAYMVLLAVGIGLATMIL